ncbi:hypothetical protein M758_3G221100 [Ceratodon purpureus]|nr:hypothetical protein M758_3G221100 [Ceratodon purpureus]
MASSVESTTSVQAKDDQSSNMLESFLSTTSVVLTEISEADDVHDTLMVESSRPTTSIAITNIGEAEDKPNSESSSSPRSSSSEDLQVNPIIEELKLDYPDIGYGDFNILEEELQNECPRLKKELEDGKGKIPEFLKSSDRQGAKEQVEEVVNKFNAIQYVSNVLLPKHRSTKVMDDIKESKVDMGENKQMKNGVGNGTSIEDSLLDLYRSIFTYALEDRSSKKTSTISKELSTIMMQQASKSTNSWGQYRQTEFMIFLVKKVRKERNIMDGLGESEACVVAKCISKYEEESFAACISHVRQLELKEAAKMLKETIKSMKPNDTLIINRGRVYNSVLQEAIGHQVQMPDSELQLLPKDPHHKNNWSKHCLQDLTKVQDFFVDLFLGDEEFMQQLTFDWMEKHKYPYLILCVWECHQRQKKDEEFQHYITAGVDQKSLPSKSKRHSLDISKLCKPTGTGSDLESGSAQSQAKLVQYAFHSVVLMNRQDIIENLILKEWPDLDINAPCDGITALHVAVHKGYEKMLRYLLKQKQLDINARTARKKEIMFDLPQHRTALHIATEYGYASLVELLCRDDLNLHRKSIRCHEEDANNITALDIVYEKLKHEVWKECCYQHNEEYCETCYASYEDIEKILLSLEDVQKGIDRLYRNRQVHVDAANTILVGAALIAGVTFAGWLQPPLGYAQYYDFPTPSPAPPGTYDSYIGVEGNVGIQAFAIFNSLSFFFAIATVIVGADAAFPMDRYKYIGHVVQMMQLLLRRAIKLLMISVVCVLGAFGSAAVVILPPHVYFRRHLVLTIFVGGGVCSVLLWQLLTRHSQRVRLINYIIRYFISKYTNLFVEPKIIRKFKTH